MHARTQSIATRHLDNSPFLTPAIMSELSSLLLLGRRRRCLGHGEVGRCRRHRRLWISRRRRRC